MRSVKSERVRAPRAARNRLQYSGAAKGGPVFLEAAAGGACWRWRWRLLCCLPLFSSVFVLFCCCRYGGVWGLCDCLTER